MDDSQNNFDENIVRELTVLWNTPQRNQEMAHQGRLAFLQAAREIQIGAVSRDEKSGHKGWMQKIQSIFERPKKEHSPMLTAIATFLVITTLVLGGTGATVAAAQGSLPDSPLYDIKLMTEALRLELEDDPRVDFDLTQQFLDERLVEIQTMVEDGSELPEDVETGLQAQIEAAIILALNLPEDQAEPALEQMRARLETHLQALTRLQDNENQHAFATVFRTRVMMLSKMKLLEEGIASQETNKGKNKQEESAETPLVEETAKPVHDNNGNSKIEETPAAGNGNGNAGADKPNKDATETNGNNGNGSDKPKVEKTANPNAQSQPANDGKEDKSNNGNGKKK